MKISEQKERFLRTQYTFRLTFFVSTVLAVFLSFIDSSNALDIKTIDEPNADKFNAELAAFKPGMLVFATPDQKHYLAWAPRLVGYGTDHLTSLPHGFFWGDEKDFFQLDGGDTDSILFPKSGDKVEGTVTFGDKKFLNIGREEVQLKGTAPNIQAQLKCGWKTSSLTSVSSEKAKKLTQNARFSPLPDTPYFVDFFYKIPGTENYIYGDQPKYYSEKYIRFFIGPKGKMVQHHINWVSADFGQIKLSTTENDVFSGRLSEGEPGSDTAFTEWSNSKSNSSFKGTAVSGWNHVSPLESVNPKKFDLSSLGISGVPTTLKLKSPCDE
jgi:hypothetical protein